MSEGTVMSYDLALVLGIVISGFSIPAIVSAFSDSRAPRAASLMVLLGGGLVAWAVIEKPGGIYDGSNSRCVYDSRPRSRRINLALAESIAAS